MTTPEQALPETPVTARRRSFYGIKVTDITLPGGPCRKVVYPAPLPGVIIFVHGVNSTGEWFDAAEEAAFARGSMPACNAMTNKWPTPRRAASSAPCAIQPS
nr:hypothetical protein [Ralstonia mannitolilytica]